jgi:hypothetical protein
MKLKFKIKAKKAYPMLALMLIYRYFFIHQSQML